MTIAQFFLLVIVGAAVAGVLLLMVAG